MKLRYVRNGHKSAAAKLVQRFAELKESDIEEINTEEVLAIEERLESRVKLIEDLNNKILDELNEEVEIEAEIVESGEYSLTLQVTLQSIKLFIKARCSNMNVNSNVADFTDLTQTQPLQVTPQDESDDPRTTIHSNYMTETRDPMIYPQPTTLPSSSFSKLPKLELPKFDGDIMEWSAFWDSYESAVHSNHSITNVQKFNYLKSLLVNEPLQTVSGFSLTNTNYEKAIKHLHERYGQRDRIIQTYMQTLLDLPAPSSSAESLRVFHDKLEIYIRGLESLGQSECTYGSLLVTVVMNKLPVNIRQDLIREHVNPNWTLADLRLACEKNCRY